MTPVKAIRVGVEFFFKYKKKDFLLYLYLVCGSDGSTMLLDPQQGDSMWQYRDVTLDKLCTHSCLRRQLVQGHWKNNVRKQLNVSMIIRLAFCCSDFKFPKSICLKLKLSSKNVSVTLEVENNCYDFVLNYFDNLFIAFDPFSMIMLGE